MKDQLKLLSEQMKRVIITAFEEKTFHQAHIIEAMQLTRAVFALEQVILITNQKNQLQLETVFRFSEDGVEETPKQTILLEKQEYDRMVAYFMEHPITDAALPELKAEYDGTIMRCPILHGGDYYGHISFCTKEERAWSDEEKVAIKELSFLLRIYFGLNNLNRDYEMMNSDLMKERERLQEVEQMAMIDPLTGAYNRHAFERMLKELRKEKLPMGFVLIDVDHFKTVNDTYGHKFGDEVLVRVAKRLQTSLRNKDKVFRFGGDEFALVLYGCHSDAWSSLQMKLSNLHHYLKETIEKDITVTLSAGFYQFDDGYHDDMLKLADEALYHTKSSGRAGFTQIDADHQIVYEWYDTNLSDRRKEIPKAAEIGKWRVEFPKDDTLKPALFLDETAHLLLEFPNTQTPEECFEAWYRRIVPRHLELYTDMKNQLYNVGHGECIHHWIHPSKGEIAIRNIGQSRELSDAMEIYGYMREVRDDIVLSYDDGQFLMQALSRIYFCSYYINLMTGEYHLVMGREQEPHVQEKHEHIEIDFQKYITRFVYPDYRTIVEKFVELSTLSDRLRDKDYIDCRYLSLSDSGWCQIRFVPVKWDSEGRITHVLGLSSKTE